jgi:hypothetical protein
MSVPPDLMQQLLQGGLLNVQGSPNVQGGLLGAGDQATAPYGGLTNIGLQLMANSNSGGKFGQIFGKSMLDSQQLSQQTALKKIEMAQQLMGLGMTAQKMQALAPFLGGAPGGAAGPPQAAPQGVPQAASAAMPQMPGQMPAQPPQGVPAQPQGGLLGMTQQPQAVAAASDDISQTPIAGMSPDLYRRLQLVQGKDPLETEKEIRGLQLQTVQQQVKPQLDALDTIIKSDKPTQYVQSHPALMQQLQQGAQLLGIDLSKGANDQIVRTALTAQRNSLASRAQLGQEAPPNPLQTIPGALGSIYQKDPITGKLTQVKAEESLKDVIDPKTGMPTNVRASAAEGKQPFNQSIFGASNMSDQAIQMASDYARSHGGVMPAGFSRSPAIVAKVYDRMAQDSSASGDTMGAITARGAALKANGQALGQIQKLETATNQYANTLDKNLDNLVTAYKAAGNAGSPMITKALRFWQQGVTGDPQTASMVTWLNAVQGEYAKLKSGSLGNAGATNAAMDDAKEVINKNMNEGGIEAVAAAMRAEKENRVAAIGEEKQRLMGSMSVNAPSATTPAPSTAIKPETKVVGGKTYVSLGGGRWAAQ